MKRPHAIPTLLLLAALCLQSTASHAAGKLKVYHKPNLISMSFKQTDIAEIYEMLSRQNNINILLAKDVDGEISVNLYDVTVKEAIYAIATAANLAVERIKNGYLISQHSKAGKIIAGGMKSIRTYKIQYSDVKKVSEIIEKHLSQYGNIDLLEERKILVIEDLPDFLEQIESLLRQLDQAPAQILIEAKIFTITLDNTQRYGIDWTKTFNASGGKGNVGTENLGKQATDLAIGSFAGPAGLFFNYFNKNIEFQLNLLSQKNRVRALSTPKLLALEHQESEVIIGKRTGYKLTTQNNGTFQETVKFIESGVILRVTPYIDRFGRIMMDIHPEVSNTTLREGDIPDQTTTEVSTQLLVENGQTVFIGGLIRNDITSNHQGVPILEDIPLLGNLFGKDDDVSVSTETIVMIKPQIIRPHNLSLITAPQQRIDHFGKFSKQQSDKIDHFFKEKFLYKKPEETKSAEE